MAEWAWWHQRTGPDDYRIRELLRAIWDLHAMYGADDPWLWRGQANASYNLEPGMHTRIKRVSTFEDPKVDVFTRDLIFSARKARLDLHEGIALPDMAVLALLQHHGAATPLLDVSLDPMLGLYMAVVSPNSADDNCDGALFAIKRPGQSIGAFDSREFASIYGTLPGAGVVLYSAPDVSERLRIQRGHFLLGKVSAVDDRVTIPLAIEPAHPVGGSWIWTRMRGRGEPGAVPAATTPVAAFRVTAKFKVKIRSWLEERSGLTRDFVYPTPWHQPHLDGFAKSHGRLAAF